MKAIRKALFAAMAAATVVLGGCDLLGLGDDATVVVPETPAETPTETPAAEVITTKVYDGKKAGSTYEYLYIDLDDPDNPASSGGNAAWDIMITGQKEILTNSGVTAASLSSGGLGGAVFSGGTDITATTTASAAAAAFLADSGDGKDYSFWDKYQTSSAAPTAASTGNAISFPGYKTQDGRDGASSATAWVFGAVGSHVDVDFSLGTAYAKWERMSPAFSDFTNNVYYVRSGDGLSYYKLQVSEATYTASSSSTDGKTHYTFKVKFAKLN